MRTSWPFTGRSTTLDEIVALLDAADQRGAVVAGDPGVGKTRLVNEALRRLEPGRFTVLRVGATRAVAAVPFGAFGHVLPPEPGEAAVNPLRWATDALRPPAAAPLLMAVDDAHLLDPTSAALLHHLVLHQEARVLATVRAGAAAPDPVTALWKDDLAARLELPPLSATETQDAVEGALGGEVDMGTARRLWQTARGNLLFLRELVIAGLSSGRLAEARGIWGWRGDLPVTPRLRELVEARLGTVDPAVREVLEYVALGEPLGAAVLAGLTGDDAVELAERRGLVELARDDRRLEARLAHPLYGDVVRARAGSRRVGARLAALAAAVEATGLRRRGDLLRVALWRLESGTPSGADLLLAGCRQAWALHDADLAVRCGRAALAAGVRPPEAVRVAGVLFLSGHHDETEDHLARPPAAPMDEATAVAHACTRAANLWLGLGDRDRAERLLEETAERTADPRLRQDLYAYKSIGAVYAADLPAAEREAARTRTPGPVSASAAALVEAGEALRLMLTGRLDEAIELCDAALARAPRWADALPNLWATFNDARAAAALYAGDLAAADGFIAEGERLFAGEHRWHVAAETSRSLRAEHCLLRGEVRQAVRWAHDAASYSGRAVRALSNYGHETLAYAAAISADVATAGTAAAAAERRRVPAGLIFHFRADLARAWIQAASGDVAGGAAAARRAADRRAAAGLRVYEMFALHDAVRLAAPTPRPAAPTSRPTAPTSRPTGPTPRPAAPTPRPTGPGSRPAGSAAGAASTRAGESSAAGWEAGVAERLGRLTEVIDGPLVRALARHAAALAADDGPGLDGASAAFAELGMTLYAAEAAARAARAHERAGDARAARAAAARAWVLIGRCQGARTPAMSGSAAPELTARQIEIARLAAAGLGNREIADRLVLSIRTVANHLHAAYERLGVSDRAELSELLAGPD